MRRWSTGGPQRSAGDPAPSRRWAWQGRTAASEPSGVAGIACHANARSCAVPPRGWRPGVRRRSSAARTLRVPSSGEAGVVYGRWSGGRPPGTSIPSPVGCGPRARERPRRQARRAAAEYTATPRRPARLPPALDRGAPVARSRAGGGWSRRPDDGAVRRDGTRDDGDVPPKKASPAIEPTRVRGPSISSGSPDGPSRSPRGQGRASGGLASSVRVGPSGITGPTGPRPGPGAKGRPGTSLPPPSGAGPDGTFPSRPATPYPSPPRGWSRDRRRHPHHPQTPWACPSPAPRCRPSP